MNTIYKKIAFLPLLLLVTGCANEDELKHGSNDNGFYSLQVQMPGCDNPTRVGLTQIEGTKDLKATWQADDEVLILLTQEDKDFNAGKVGVSDISEDGKQATINFVMPNGINQKKPFTVYSFTGIEATVQYYEDKIWHPRCMASLLRAPIEQFKAPMFAQVEANYDQPSITTFHHFGTYELLHVQNSSNDSINFAHNGFDVDMPWYQAAAFVEPNDGNGPVSPTGEWDGENFSDSQAIAAGDEGVFISWYIPSGFPIADAHLLASVNGQEFSSTNTFSSEVSLQRGHAYHMYATWDGKELKFDNVDDNSFHLSANSISLYVNTESPVTIFNGSGDYDVINENPDIVDYDINGVHVAHAPNRYFEPGEDGRPIEGDLWWITAKKIGEASLKLIDKQTNKELSLSVTVIQAPSLSLAQSNVEMNVGETKHVEILTGSEWYEVTADNNSVVSVSKATISTSGGGREELGSSYTGIYVIIEALSAGEAIVTVKDLSSGETEDINVRVSSSNPSCPVAEAIDLGLPSGTKWASWNVGASKPEEYGGHYAWGETEEKDYYDWSTYKYYNSETGEIIHIGDDIAGTEYDVAHVKWGGSWRMPTRAQQDELRENCTREWTQQNGVNGIRVTGPNGNSIFLPAAGSWLGYLYDEGSYGYYWSSSLRPYGVYRAYFLYFYSNSWDWFDNHRSDGRSVRAVCP